MTRHALIQRPSRAAGAFSISRMSGQVDIILIPDLAACVTVLWCLRSIYWNECRTIGINAQITRHNMTSYIGTIYVGSCRGAGTQPPGAAAHAHQDGTGHICIFLAGMSLTNLEGVLAHEYAHILTPWYEVRPHGTVWQANLTKLGYAEDANRYLRREWPTSRWSYVANRNPGFRAHCERKDRQRHARISSVVSAANQDESRQVRLRPDQLTVWEPLQIAGAHQLKESYR